MTSPSDGPADNIVPVSEDEPRAPRSKSSALIALAVVVLLVGAIAGVGYMARPDPGPTLEPEIAAPEDEDEVDDETSRPAEVLGEVVERPDFDATTTTTVSDTSPITAPRAAGTTSTTARPRLPRPAPATTTTTAPRPADAPPPVDLAVEATGTVIIEQQYSPGTKERYQPNADCGTLHESYEVVVTDDEGRELDTGALANAVYEREDDQWGWTITRCTYEYAVTLPEEPTYTFALVEPWDHSAVKDAASTTPSELRENGGRAPELRQVNRYCPECND